MYILYNIYASIDICRTGIRPALGATGTNLVLINTRPQSGTPPSEAAQTP